MTVRELVRKVALLDKLSKKCFNCEDLLESEADAIAQLLDEYRNMILDVKVSE